MMEGLREFLLRTGMPAPMVDELLRPVDVESPATFCIVAPLADAHEVAQGDVIDLVTYRTGTDEELSRMHLRVDGLAGFWPATNPAARAIVGVVASWHVLDAGASVWRMRFDRPDFRRYGPLTLDVTPPPRPESPVVAQAGQLVRSNEET